MSRQGRQLGLVMLIPCAWALRAPLPHMCKDKHPHLRGSSVGLPLFLSSLTCCFKATCAGGVCVREDFFDLPVMVFVTTLHRLFFSQSFRFDRLQPCHTDVLLQELEVHHS